MIVENENNVIYVFGRKDKESYTKIIKNFKPYFFVKDDEGECKSIFGDKLKKIVCKLPSDIPKLREGKEHFEADILFTNRYLTDEYDGTIAKEKIRKCYLDLEVDSEFGMPSVKDGDSEIQSIATYDNFLKKYNVFILRNDDGDFEIPGHNLFFFDDEKELLTKFIEFIKSTNPDMFIAYNGNGFDFPYLINRLKTLKMNVNQLSRMGKTYTSEDRYMKNNYKSVCKGRVLFDLMQGIKYISQGERTSWSLEYISQYELGEGKEKFDGSLTDLYRDNLKKFVIYNIKDVELMIKLDNSLHVIDFFDAIRRYARCNFIDCFNNSRLIDAVLLKHSKLRNIVLPSRNYKNHRTIKGAFVQSIKAGLYKMIAVLDWKSLYPNIITTFDLSPEMMTKEMFGDVITVNNKFMKSPLYFKKGEGLIAEVCRTLLEERTHYKQLMYEAETKEEEHAYDILQYAVKVIANSVFGVIKGKCRLSVLEIAEAITTMGQYIIQKSSEIAEKYGYEVIYCDSVIGSSEIKVDNKRMTIENFWKMLRHEPNTDRKDKEEKNIEKYNFMSLGIKEGKHKYIIKSKIKRIIRHKVKKKLYKIKTESGKYVIVTEDHSIPIKRNEKNILVNPTKIQKNDKVFTYNKTGRKKGSDLSYMYEKKYQRKGSKKSNKKNKLSLKNYFEKNDIHNKGMKPKDWMSPKAYNKWVEEKSYNNPIFRKIGLFQEMTNEEKYANMILEPLGFQYNKTFGTGDGGTIIWETVRFVPDFCNEKEKIIIEIDGDCHNSMKERDKVKDRFFIQKGYVVYRIRNEEIKEKIEELICQLNLKK